MVLIFFISQTSHGSTQSSMLFKMLNNFYEVFLVLHWYIFWLLTTILSTTTNRFDNLIWQDLRLSWKPKSRTKRLIQKLRRFCPVSWQDLLTCWSDSGNSSPTHHCWLLLLFWPSLFCADGRVWNIFLVWIVAWTCFHLWSLNKWLPILGCGDAPHNNGTFNR